MNDKYIFFSDESAHDRNISENTITRENFFVNFVTAFIGFKKDLHETIINEIVSLKKKYGIIKELKSIKYIPKKYCKHGFKTFPRNNLNIIDDLLEIILKYEFHTIVCVQNKIETLAYEIIKHNSLLNKRPYLYAFVKILSTYWESNLLTLLVNNDIDGFVEKFKEKISDILYLHIGDSGYKQENAYLIMFYKFLSVNECKIEYKNRYEDNFKVYDKYLRELKITSSYLTIDQEGTGETLRAAQKILGNNDVTSLDSELDEGLQIADMFTGLCSKMIQSISDDMHNDLNNPDQNEILYDWFDMEEKHFKLYVKIAKIIFKYSSDSKLVSTYFNESTMLFFGFCTYISKFTDYNDYKTHTIEEIRNGFYNQLDIILASD